MSMANEFRVAAKEAAASSLPLESNSEAHPFSTNANGDSNPTSNPYWTSMVCDKPYYPNLLGDASSDASVVEVACVVVLGRLPPLESIRIFGREEEVVMEEEDVQEEGSVAATPDQEDTDSKTKASSTRKKGYLKVQVVSGGITNALFRVSGFQTLPYPELSPPFSPFSSSKRTPAIVPDPFYQPAVNDVLVRIFGAEGMIDRDEETCTFAALSEAGLAPMYFGRFGNGRLEGWLDGYRPLQTIELSRYQGVSMGIAKRMAQLHVLFNPAASSDTDTAEHNNNNNPPKPGMFPQLLAWMDQATSDTTYPFKSPSDIERQKTMFDLQQIQNEVSLLHQGHIPCHLASNETKTKSFDFSKSSIAFCHNDLLAGNIMISTSTSTTTSTSTSKKNPPTIKFIDFEYGGYNYAAFDIANHFNEWAGGTDDAMPKYHLFPTLMQQRRFLVCYLEEAKKLRLEHGLDGNNSGRQEEEDDEEELVQQQQQQQRNITEEEIQTMMEQVTVFVLANHLYWGLWAVNQAKAEGCDGFDYLEYASRRFQQFYVTKEKMVLGEMVLEEKGGGGGGELVMEENGGWLDGICCGGST